MKKPIFRPSIYREILPAVCIIVAHLYVNLSLLDGTLLC